jgi:hypothetical protein
VFVIQQEVPNRVKASEKGREILTTVFAFGPIRVVVIANIPDEGEKQSTSYVRIELIPDAGWSVFNSDRSGKRSSEPCSFCVTGCVNCNNTGKRTVG